jgi:hypothetical protein
MQFTYSNSNNYLAGAKEVNDISTNIYNVSRQTGVDTNKLIETERKARASKADAKNAAEGTIGRTSVNLLAGIKKGDIERKSKKDVEKIMKPAKRMAGVLALTNTGLAVKKMGQDAAIDAQERAETKRIRDENASQYSKEMADLRKLREAQIAALTKTDETESEQLAPSSTSTSTSSIPVASGTTLTGSSKKVADAIAGPESGSFGYEAFNQGGAKGGTKVLGKSGSHKEVFGTPLTNMTLGQIFDKQNTKQQGLSLDEHFKTGGLHAVGRYQFIGSTLQDEVSRMGLSKDTKFTPEVQDQIFLSHLKRVGNISPWVGPSTQYSPEKISELNNLIASL